MIKEVEEEEKNLTSTPEKAPSVLAPLQLSQLRTKNTDSFDMEEVCCSAALSWGFSHWYLLMSGLFQHGVLHPVPTQGNWNVLLSHNVVSDAFKIVSAHLHPLPSWWWLGECACFKMRKLTGKIMALINIYKCS